MAIDSLSNNIANKEETIIMYERKIDIKISYKENTSEIEVAKILYFYHGLMLLHFL